MKHSRPIILVLVLAMVLVSGCSHFQNKESSDQPTKPGMAKFSNEDRAIGELIKEYEGEVVAQNKHATLVRAERDLDNDGVVGRADKCPGTPKGAPVDNQGCWVVSPILFELNSQEISSTGKTTLDATIPVLKRNPALTLSVEGHSCNQGDPAYNMALSLQRAQIVKQYLMDKGVDGARMVVVGYGPNKPSLSNATRSNRIQNRRVEIRPVKG